MSKNDEKKIKIRKLIIIATILLIVLIVIFAIIFFSKANMAKLHVAKINSLDTDYSNYIMPLNRNEMIKNYKGEVSRETIYTLIYEFSLDVLPQFRKSGTENVEQFYKKNKEFIYTKTGIDNIETYMKFVEKIKNLPEDLTLSKTEIKEGSVKKQGIYIYATLVIYYNDDSQLVEINIKLENSVKNDRTSVVFN